MSEGGRERERERGDSRLRLKRAGSVCVCVCVCVCTCMSVESRVGSYLSSTTCVHRRVGVSGAILARFEVMVERVGSGHENVAGIYPS